MKFIKWFFIIVVCPVVALFLAIDSGVVDKNKQNDIFRIDLRSDAPAQSVRVLASDVTFSQPGWCNNCLSGTGHFNMTEDGSIKVQFKAIRNDRITINLMGQDIRINNVRVPVLVEYENLIVGGEKVFDKPVRVWHDQPYKYIVDMKAGQTLSFSVLPKKPSNVYLVKYLHVNPYMFILYFACLIVIYSVFLKFSKKKVK